MVFQAHHAVFPTVTRANSASISTGAYAETHGLMGSDVTRKALALVDAEIGRIEDTLRARRVLDRTNLIVTSDHGFSTHTGELRLGALLEPLSRSTAAGPDFREGRVSSVPTANVDLAPTLLHLLGLPKAPSMTGRVIEEALRIGQSPSSARVERRVEPYEHQTDRTS